MVGKWTGIGRLVHLPTICSMCFSARRLPDQRGDVLITERVTPIGQRWVAKAQRHKQKQTSFDNLLRDRQHLCDLCANLLREQRVVPCVYIRSFVTFVVTRVQ